MKRIKLLELLNELEFSSEEDFQNYQSKHKMRKSTAVKVAGKNTTVGDLDKKAPSKSDHPALKNPNIKTTDNKNFTVKTKKGDQEFRITGGKNPGEQIYLRKPGKSGYYVKSTDINDIYDELASRAGDEELQKKTAEKRKQDREQKQSQETKALEDRYKEIYSNKSKKQLQKTKDDLEGETSNLLYKDDLYYWTNYVVGPGGGTKKDWQRYQASMRKEWDKLSAKRRVIDDLLKS